MNLIDCDAHCLPPTILDALRKKSRCRNISSAVSWSTARVSTSTRIRWVHRRIRCALDCTSAHRIVLGGDYPISPPEIGLGYTIPRLDKAGVSASDRAKIERGNASKLLNFA